MGTNNRRRMEFRYPSKGICHVWGLYSTGFTTGPVGPGPRARDPGGPKLLEKKRKRKRKREGKEKKKKRKEKKRKAAVTQVRILVTAIVPFIDPSKRAKIPSSLDDYVRP